MIRSSLVALRPGCCFRFTTSLYSRFRPKSSKLSRRLSSVTWRTLPFFQFPLWWISEPGRTGWRLSKTNIPICRARVVSESRPISSNGKRRDVSGCPPRVQHERHDGELNSVRKQYQHERE